MLLRKRFIIPLVLIALFMIFQPMGRVRTLRKAAAGADQVRIVLYTPEKHDRPSMSIKGRAKVEEFLNLISLQPTVLSPMWGGTEEIQLVRGGETLVRLNYGGSKLIWMGGRWKSHGHLTDASVSDIREWIDSNGGSELAQARTQPHSCIISDCISGKRALSAGRFQSFFLLFACSTSGEVC